MNSGKNSRKGIQVIDGRKDANNARVSCCLVPKLWDVSFLDFSISCYKTWKEGQKTLIVSLTPRLTISVPPADYSASIMALHFSMIACVDVSFVRIAPDNNLETQLWWFCYFMIEDAVSRFRLIWRELYVAVFENRRGQVCVLEDNLNPNSSCSSWFGTNFINFKIIEEAVHCSN